MDKEQDIFKQLQMMTVYLSRLETLLEDVVKLLARSQISPSG